MIVRGGWTEEPAVKLLLVDDDAVLASALRRGLTAEGFLVEVAVDGPEGLWRGREGSYDLILLDIMLPKMHGYRVCAELRRSGVRTPILMLTGKDGEYDEAEALDTGADDYLRKPFSFPVLVSRIHALLRRAALGAPPPLTAGSGGRRWGSRRRSPPATSSWTCGPAASGAARSRCRSPPASSTCWS